MFGVSIPMHPGSQPLVWWYNPRFNSLISIWIRTICASCERSCFSNLIIWWINTSCVSLRAIRAPGPAWLKFRFLLIERAWTASNRGDKGTVASLSGGDVSCFDVGGVGVIILSIGSWDVRWIPIRLQLVNVVGQGSFLGIVWEVEYFFKKNRRKN